MDLRGDIAEALCRSGSLMIWSGTFQIQFTDVYEDSNDSIGKHGKSSEKPTSASDLSTSIIHTPRSRAIQVMCDKSSLICHIIMIIIQY